MTSSFRLMGNWDALWWIDRGPGAPGFEGDAQSDRGDDAPEDLEGRGQCDMCDDDAGKDGRQREGGVGGDVEGRHGRGAVLMRYDRRQRTEAAEEGGPEARAAEDRAGEVGGARAVG